MNKLKYFLLLFILFLTPKVFAAEYNMNSKTSATLNGTKNRYLGTEIYNTGTTNTYTFGTRYNGKLSSIDSYFDYPFEEGTTYRLTYNMNTDDFRNNFGGKYWWDCSQTMNSTNQHLGTFTYVSYKKVQFTFTPTEDTTCIRVLLGSTNLSSNAITGVSNWQLDSITLYDPDYQSGSSGNQGTTPSITPTPNSNQDIINNQNNNTQDIINNNNENTNNIIENNNENTEKIIDSLNDCHTSENLLNIPEGLYTNSGIAVDFKDGIGTFGGFYNLPTTIAINIPNTLLTAGTYTLGTYSNVGRYPYIILRNNGTQIVRVAEDTGKLTFTLNTDTNINEVLLYYGIDTNYNTIKPILNKGDSLKPFEPFGEICTSKLDETTNAINQQNEYLMDDSNPNISDNDFLNTFNSIGINDPLSYLLTLPTQLINKLVSSSNTCSSINLGSLYGVNLTLPCIDLESILGVSIWSIIDVITSVSLLSVILKNLYDTFSNLLTMGAEKEAKEKFSMPTPMDFLSMILGGDR